MPTCRPSSSSPSSSLGASMRHQARRSCPGQASARRAHRWPPRPRARSGTLARRRIMFSPTVAMRWVISSATVRPVPGIGGCLQRSRYRRLRPAPAWPRWWTTRFWNALVAGDEIGFRVDFHHRQRLLRGGGHAHQALGRHAAGFLRGGRQPLLAQPVDRVLQIAIGLGQGFFCNPSCRRRSARAAPSPSAAGDFGHRC